MNLPSPAAKPRTDCGARQSVSNPDGNEGAQSKEIALGVGGVATFWPF